MFQFFGERIRVWQRTIERMVPWSTIIGCGAVLAGCFTALIVIDGSTDARIAVALLILFAVGFGTVYIRRIREHIALAAVQKFIERLRFHHDANAAQYPTNVDDLPRIDAAPDQ